MRLLFVKDALAFPRSSGHDVHCFHMMQALARLGHDVSLATLTAPADAAVAGLALRERYALADLAARGDGAHAPQLTRLQERFRSYWGVDPARISAVAAAAEAFRADVVVAVGLGVLPYLGALTARRRVWYAADEWFWHHISLVRLLEPKTWRHLRPALVKGLYERAYAPLFDRVWVVSPADARAMRIVAGVRAVDVLPNGVDTEHYAPSEAAPEPRTCVFWGRLDFEPNLQGLAWFCRKVWPRVRSAAPDARFSIFGFKPGPEARALAAVDGVSLVPDLPDIRDEVRRRAVVVLPFVSGGGIKNKLLEAASMGLAIVGTPRACGGLRLDGAAPFATARRPGAFAGEIVALFADDARRRALGAAARRFVLAHHTWDAAARGAVAGLERTAAKAGGA